MEHKWRRGLRAGGMLALVLVLGGRGRGPGGTVAAAPQAQAPGWNAVTDITLDNVGGGWAWGGQPRPAADGDLLRLQNGVWTAVDRNDPAGGAIVRLSPSIYEFALTNTPGEGWAIGTGGGPRIWHLTGGIWKAYAHNLARGVSLGDLTVSTDGKAGWLTGNNLDAGVPTLLRLQNNTWTASPEPANARLENVVISPNGQYTWAWGVHTNDNSKGVWRWADGRWQEVAGEIPSEPIIHRIVADNAGNGWIVNPPNYLTHEDNVLFRLSANGPVKSVVLALPSVRNGVLYLDDAAVDGLGRGWASGSVGQVRLINGVNTEVYQAVLFRLQGASITEVPLDDIATTQGSTPPFIGPLAISPDGAHSWMGSSGADFGKLLLALLQLREPWAHPTPAQAAPLPGAGRCFAEVPYCLRGVFAAFWTKNGGLDQFGYPVTPEVQETQGGKTYTVQYTERARFEYHPENKPPYDVLLGLLGNTLVEPRLSEAPFQAKPASATPAAQWFKETQHNVGPPFLAYWQEHGGLPVFGLPRSEAFEERNAADGKVYRVQYFERNRLEYHPENVGTKFEMLLGLLGVEQFGTTYGYTP